MDSEPGGRAADSSTSSSAAVRGFWLRVLERKAFLIAATALLALLLLPGLLRLRSDNSPSVFFVSGSPAVASYAEHRRLFPGGDNLRLVLRGETVLSSAGLRYVGELGKGAAATPGVAHVSSLSVHHDRNGWPPRDVEGFRARVLDNRLDRAAGFVSADGRTVTLLVELAAESKEARLATLDKLGLLLKKRRPASKPKSSAWRSSTGRSTRRPARSTGFSSRFWRFSPWPSC